MIWGFKNKQEVAQSNIKPQDDDPLKKGKAVEISQVINEAVEQSRLNAEKRKITLAAEASDEAKTFGDRNQITMAIHNLIENAINYSPDNTRVAITKSLCFITCLCS